MVSTGVAALAAPLALNSPRTAAACTDVGSAEVCGVSALAEAAPPDYKPWWVQVHLPTLLWPNLREIDNAIGKAEAGRLFQVQAPQDGSRLHVFDPRTNKLVFIGAEAVGPVGAPAWARHLNGLDGRWIDVTLSYPFNAIAMQADQQVHRALVIAGMVNFETQMGHHQILRRVANETMDSRTIPGMPISYRYTNVLYTQYFTGDGAAIHYNYWSGNFGSRGSRGCLGMTLADSKFFWEWAGLGVPLYVHA
jgi:hypothetical protein